MIESPMPPYLRGEELTSIGNAIASLVDKIVKERLKDAVPKCTILSVQAAMDRYDVTRTTIYRWFGDGTLRKHMVGGRVYCFIEDFERQKTKEEVLRGKR